MIVAFVVIVEGAIVVPSSGQLWPISNKPDEQKQAKSDDKDVSAISIVMPRLDLDFRVFLASNSIRCSQISDFSVIPSRNNLSHFVDLPFIQEHGILVLESPDHSILKILYQIIIIIIKQQIIEQHQI